MRAPRSTPIATLAAVPPRIDEVIILSKREPDERLAGCAEKHWKSKFFSESPETVDQLEILFASFSKANARIDDDLLVAHAVAPRNRN